MTEIPGLAFTLEEGIAANEEAYARRGERGPRDGRVCVCGHPARRHVGLQGEMLCKPTRMECPCRALVPVLETDDTRTFLWRTSGLGAQHALGRGIAAAVDKERKWEWIGTLACWKCGAEGEGLLPCAVTRVGQVSRGPSRMNALLCRRCVDEVGVVG